MNLNLLVSNLLQENVFGAIHLKHGPNNLLSGIHIGQ